MLVSIPLMRTLFAIPLLLVPFAVACGDDGAGNDPGLSPLPTVTVTASASSPSPTSEAPTPDPGLPLRLAESPAYLLYEVSRGDTLEAIGSAFGSSASELAEVNALATDGVTEGQFLAIPLYPDPGLLVPAESLSTALGLDAQGVALQLLGPSTALIDGYLGRVALARVRTTGPDSVDGAGYVLEFYFTDRAPLKGGVADPEARFTDPVFTLGGGSLAPDLLNMTGAAFGAFQLEGASYAVVTYPETGVEPAAIWEGLEPLAP